MRFRRRQTRWMRLFFGFVSIGWMAVQASAQEDTVPIIALRFWQHHNNEGWRQFDRGDYVKAAERFDLAIKEILPFEKAGRRLLAQLLRFGQGDLPSETLRRSRAAGKIGTHRPRRGQEGQARLRVPVPLRPGGNSQGPETLCGS